MIDFSKPLVRLAVVSDIHAYSSKINSEDSLLDFTGSVIGSPNPLNDLGAEIEKQQLKADLLICAGDISNRADCGGLERAWEELNKLKVKLGATQLIATCGNHDLDSRYLSNEADPDPKGALMSLNPPFPFGDAAIADKFWARNYALHTHASGAVIASLNTSAYHGGKQEEILHGRVSKRTVDAIAEELSDNKNAPAHVLVCHHHPMPLRGDGRSNDNEYIRNGQELLDRIVESTGRSCLVIHGHRHKPRMISGASGSTATTFILGAGSLGARITGVSNQFHIVNIYQSTINEHASIVGTVETWSWAESSGWNHIGNLGLPAYCGFGYRGQINNLSTKIAKIVGKNFAKWETVRKQIPSVDLLMPDDLIQLENELQKLGLAVLRGKDGRPMQVGT